VPLRQAQSESAQDALERPSLLQCVRFDKGLLCIDSAQFLFRFCVFDELCTVRQIVRYRMNLNVGASDAGVSTHFCTNVVNSLLTLSKLLTAFENSLIILQKLRFEFLSLR